MSNPTIFPYYTFPVETFPVDIFPLSSVLVSSEHGCVDVSDSTIYGLSLVDELFQNVSLSNELVIYSVRIEDEDYHSAVVAEDVIHDVVVSDEVCPE